MRHLVRLIAIVVVPALVACSDGGPTAPSPVDMQVTLAPGQTAGIEGTAAGVRFDGVTGDSRCPIDAICVTGGDATVHIAVVTPTTTTPYELHTGTMLPVRHRDLTIVLVDLQPYPFSARPVESSEYRATLRVTRTRFAGFARFSGFVGFQGSRGWPRRSDEGAKARELPSRFGLRYNLRFLQPHWEVVQR